MITCSTRRGPWCGGRTRRTCAKRRWARIWRRLVERDPGRLPNECCLISARWRASTRFDSRRRRFRGPPARSKMSRAGLGRLLGPGSRDPSLCRGDGVWGGRRSTPPTRSSIIQVPYAEADTSVSFCGQSGAAISLNREAHLLNAHRDENLASHPNSARRPLPIGSGWTFPSVFSGKAAYLMFNMLFFT